MGIESLIDDLDYYIETGCLSLSSVELIKSKLQEAEKRVNIQKECISGLLAVINEKDCGVRGQENEWNDLIAWGKELTLNYDRLCNNCAQRKISMNSSDRFCEVCDKSKVEENTQLKERVKGLEELLQHAAPIWKDDSEKYEQWQIKQQQLLTPKNQ